MLDRNIHKFTQGWKSGLPETPCGFGSKLENTQAQRRWITYIIEKYEIQSIADIGCGDKNWIKETNLCGAEYQGYDLIPRVEGVEKLDIVNEPAPCVDLLMCFWVVNHLTPEDCKKAISNLLNSSSKYLMLTGKKSWLHGQPKEVDMPYVERLAIDDDAYVVLVELYA